MTEQTPGQRPTTDQLLDLLLDALAERQRTRQASPSPRPSPSREREIAPSPQPGIAAPSPEQPSPTKAEIPPPRPEPPPSEQRRAAAPAAPAPRTAQQAPKGGSRPGEPGWEPPARLPSINMGKFILRLALVVVALAVLINIPINRWGVSLAHIMPDTGSLIIRDGLVLKGSGSEIYMLQDDKLRWISSMDAFEHLGLTWKAVHVVDDKFLEQFEMGQPIHLIMKCQGSPHIYALENGQKRWIKDIETFATEGYVWDDVQSVDCGYLRNLPDGPSIPEDAGPPPQP